MVKMAFENAWFYAACMVRIYILCLMRKMFCMNVLVNYDFIQTSLSKCTHIFESLKLHLELHLYSKR